MLNSIQDVGDEGFAAPTSRVSGAGTAGLDEVDVDREARLEKMRAGELGSIHSWELVTAVDGPGTRMTVFFNGCPLRCVYCHNPDTMAMKDGHPIELDELLAKIKRYRRIFKASGGGITLSGGEVLMQPAFAQRVLEGAKELGVHTAIDTSGFLGINASDAMLESVDLVLLDVKAGDPDTYKKVTGRILAPTLAFGDRLAAKNIPTWIRFVLIPGLTDDPDNVRSVAEIVSAWPNVERVEVLPFHQMGMDKWEAMGLDYELRDTKPPTFDQLDRARDIFKAKGLNVF